MKTVILTNIDLAREAQVKFYPLQGIKYLISRIFTIFVKVLASTGSKLRAWCTVDNVALAVGIVAALVGWCAAVVASETDSIESRLTLAISVLVGMIALGISIYKTLAKTPNYN